MTETVDAVVVGAGHNGLVAANMLADAGWDVVVLEATAHAGGAVRSAEVTAPGFVSDLCSAFYPLALGSAALRQLRLEEHGLHWTHAPAVVAHLLLDGRAAVLSRDIDVTAASVDRFAAGDGARWMRMYAEWQRVAPALVSTLLTPFPPVRPAAALLRRAGVGDALRLARRFMLPVRVLADQTFTGDGAKLLLTGLALHTDLSPDQTASGGYGWLLAMLGQEYGFPVPVGGAQRLTDALVTRLDAAGGRVLCDAPVERVVVGHGRALGVGCRDGRLWRARRAVLADVPATTLYRNLVGDRQLPDRLVADLAGFRWDHAVLKVDWALSGPVPWRNDAVRGAGTIHLGADLDGLTRYSASLAAGHPPPEPLLLVGQMTTADPTRSPVGTESLWAYTHLPHRDTWRAEDHDRWRAEEVDKQVERIEDTLERHAPGFRGLVIGRYVAGPQALATENPGLVGGAVNGGTAALHQQLFLRPVPGLGRADTPIDRLYLASSSAHPGGGVHGAPGANAARAALARHAPLTGRLYAAAIRVANDRLYGR